MNEFSIDVGQIARAKMPGKKIPSFVLRLVAKMIHQDFVNEFLERGFVGEDFTRECLKYLDVKTDVEGLENLAAVPDGAKCTFASNHPLGGIDGVILLNVLLPRYEGKVKVLVNDFLLFLKGLAPLCIGVNKTGGQARGLVSAVQEAFDSDDQMLFFPSGQCSRKYDGKIQDREWSKTFVNESARTGRWIVPVHFVARNSRQFYFVDRLCRLFKIKLNIPMFLLPDELYKGQHRTVKVIFGKPIDPASLEGGKNASAKAQEIRARVYDL